MFYDCIVVDDRKWEFKKKLKFKSNLINIMRKAKINSNFFCIIKVYI